MKIRMIQSAVLALALAATAACARRIGDFSMVSTGDPQYSGMKSATFVNNVEGTDSRFWILFIPLGSEPNLKEAVDRCLDKGKGDFIERARFYETGWTLIAVSYGNFSCVGDVGNSKPGKSGKSKKQSE